MTRLLISLLLIMLPGAHLASAQSDERLYSDMPVVVLYCHTDPGRLNVGGGKAPSPQSLVDDGTCRPAEGVAVTFVLAQAEWDFESDPPADEIEWDVTEDGWFNRCDTDAEGKCALESPAGFDLVLGAVLHESTVDPGYEPAFFQTTTHNYTEFTGWGLALIPDGTSVDPDSTAADHQTLALNVTQNGEAAEILTEWMLDGMSDDTYLATNDGGWVSNRIQPGQEIEIDLTNVPDTANVSATCGANDDTSVSVESEILDDGTLRVSVPETTSDIRCDVTIGN